MQGDSAARRRLRLILLCSRRYLEGQRISYVPRRPFIKSALGERSSARRESVRRRVVRQGGASRRSQVSSGVPLFEQVPLFERNGT